MWQRLKKELERNFAVSAMLTDSDVFTVGFSDFDPNEYFNLDNEDIGSADSVNLCRKITLLIFPYSVNLFEGQQNDPIGYQIKGRVYGPGMKQDVTVAQGKTPDKSENQILGGYTEFYAEQRLPQRLTLSSAFGSHLMYYRNDYTYRSDALDDYRPLLDSVYFNTDAWAVVGEINTTLKYQVNHPWGNGMFGLHRTTFMGQGGVMLTTATLAVQKAGIG